MRAWAPGLALVAMLAVPAARAQDEELLVPEGESEAVLEGLAWVPTGSVQAVAFSPDGRLLATGLDSGRVVLWDVAGGRAVRVLAGHAEAVDAVAFSPDGKLLATGSRSAQTVLWDVASGRELRRLEGHSLAVDSVAFSPDGQRLATGSWDKTARIWDVASGRSLAVLSGHAERVSSVAFSLDGLRLATASWDRTAKVWDAASGRAVLTLNHETAVLSVAFSADGGQLATGSKDASVRSWDAASGRSLRVLTERSGDVSSMAFSPDGGLLARDTDQGPELWSVASSRVVGHLEVPVGDVPSKARAMAFSADGRLLAAGPWNDTTSIWDVVSKRELWHLQGHEHSWSTAFSPDGKLLALDRWRGWGVLWNVESGRETRRLQEPIPLGSKTISPDGRYIVTAFNIGPLWLWDVASGRETRLGERVEAVSNIAFSPDGRFLAIHSQSGLMTVWEMPSGREVGRLKGEAHSMSQMILDPGGRWLATLDEDGVAMVWDISGKRPAHRVATAPANLSAIAVSPDGQLIAGSSPSATLVWEVASGREVRRFQGDTSAVSSIAFSKDGRLLATCSANKLAKVWALACGRQQRRLDVGERATECAFNGDSSLLAVGYRLGVEVWSVTAGSRVAEFRGRDEGWFGHRVGHEVFRHDDGHFLYRQRVDGALEPVSPDAPGTPAQLTAEARVSKTPGDDGDVGELSVRVTNAQGAGRAYWVRAEPAELPAGLVLLPPPTAMRLDPGTSADLKIGLSYLSPGQSSGPVDTTLRLRVVHAHGDGPLLAVPIHVSAPRLATRVSHLDKQSVTLSIHNEGDQSTGKLTLKGTLGSGATMADGAGQTLDDILPGQQREVAFPIPEALTRAGHFPLSLAIRSERWPRTRSFKFENLSVPTPYALYAGIVAGALLLAAALYYARVYRNPVVVGVARRPETLAEFPLARMPEVDRALDRARRRSPTLTAAKLPAIRWARVLKGAGPPSEAATAFADALGATLGAPLGQGAWALALPPLRLRFAERAAVMVVDGPRLEDGPAQRSAEAVLQSGAGPTKVLVLDRTEAQNAPAALSQVAGATFVVLRADDLRDLLLAEHPRQQLEATIARQVAVSELSPYQTAGGVEAETFFFGRERELRTITDQGLRNFLVVGPRQMGKSTLLKAVERRLRARADVRVEYLVLGGAELLRPMAARPNQDSTQEAGGALTLEKVAAGTRERPRVWLVDEADEFIATDAKAGYPLLREMRALGEEGRAYFVLAGFWELYRAAVFDETGPLRNFAETLRLPPLDPVASLKLVTEPMRALGLSWDSEETAAHLLEQTGQRANLMVLACKGLVESLPGEGRTLTRAHLDEVLRGSADLRDQSRRWRGSSALHRAMVRQALLLGSPSSEALRQALQARGFLLRGDEFDRALDHVELSYVLVADAGGRLHCPVPLMRRFIESERPLEVGLKEDLEDLADERTRRPPRA